MLLHEIKVTFICFRFRISNCPEVPTVLVQERLVEVFMGNNLSNTTRPTHVFLNSGETCSNIKQPYKASIAVETHEAVLDR